MAARLPLRMAHLAQGLKLCASLSPRSSLMVVAFWPSACRMEAHQAWIWTAAQYSKTG